MKGISCGLVKKHLLSGSDSHLPQLGLDKITCSSVLAVARCVGPLWHLHVSRGAAMVGVATYSAIQTLPRSRFNSMMQQLSAA
eukprot:26143-Pelagomonas_calceolata.AAC.7